MKYSDYPKFNLLLREYPPDKRKAVIDLIIEEHGYQINRIQIPVLNEKWNIKVIKGKKILFVNDQALHLLGIKREDIEGRYAPDVALRNDLLRNLISKKENTIPRFAILTGKPGPCTIEINK